MSKICYICSPYTPYEGVTLSENVELAQRKCREAMLRGYLPLAPHLYFTTMLDDNDPAQRERGLLYGLQMLALADELWVCSEYISAGMQREIETAKMYGIKVVDR